MSRGDIERGAVMSPCGLYRYLLTRKASTGEGVCLFVGAFPTFADARTDDAISMRCMEFASHRGYREMWLANAFAWRCATARVLPNIADPIGPDNDAHLVRAATLATTTICIWGADAGLNGRDAQVLAMLRGHGVQPHHLGLARGLHPRHPVNVSKNVPLWDWTEAA